jgi:hypothetical protein
MGMAQLYRQGSGLVKVKGEGFLVLQPQYKVGL